MHNQLDRHNTLDNPGVTSLDSMKDDNCEAHHYVEEIKEVPDTAEVVHQALFEKLNIFVYEG